MIHPSSSERLISMTNEHWIIYVVPIFICFLLFVSSIVFFVIAGSLFTHSEILWLSSFALASAFLLFSLHGFFLILLGESVSQIVITSTRVIRFHDVIMFREEMLEVSYEKMKTVEARKKGIIRSLLNYGSLRFENNVVIDYVPHPNGVARDIEHVLGNA